MDPVQNLGDLTWGWRLPRSILRDAVVGADLAPVPVLMPVRAQELLQELLLADPTWTKVPLPLKTFRPPLAVLFLEQT